MKVANITDADKFFEIVDNCKGKVELITANGDCLNLKPKLCQVVALAQILVEGNADRLEIVAEHKMDRQRLITFMVNGN